jgi:Ni/Co efflux regulator RcnB
MTKHLRIVVTIFAVACVCASVALSATAAEDETPTWHKTFNGHKMWMTSLDEAMAASTKDSKPMLIDVFSPT